LYGATENVGASSREAKNNLQPAKCPRVLVADDEMNIRRIMYHILKEEFEVTEAESGDEAVELIQQGMDFDVVSLDQKMPGMSGIDTLKVIKKWYPSTEVLIVTAHSDLESAKEALRLGAYDYIDKPFKKEHLRAAIRKGIKRRAKAIASGKAQEQLAFVKAQLMQSEKFSAVGELIASVVHELNNPLTAVLGFSELLLLQEWSKEQTRKYLENINNSAQLCKKITQKLLAFSRKQEPQREQVKINNIIESTIELKQHDLKVDEIEVIKQLADHMPTTIADPHELQQVFLNIINNAHHAMKAHRGKRSLTVKSEFDDTMIRVHFTDTGPGISKENLQKIFEPLFTTKENGKGTGLGLSVCYEIIQEHEGTIYVASEGGKGSCFVIEIPILTTPSLYTPSYPGKGEKLD
jgi:signal transduction histidine kinase